MNGSQDSIEPKDLTSPEGAEKAIKENHAGATQVDKGVQGTKDAFEDAIDPVQARKTQKLEALAAKREANELSKFDLDWESIFELNRYELPLTRNDMMHMTGEQALVLSAEQLTELGGFDYINTAGKRISVDYDTLEPGDVLILFPDEVGTKEKNPDNADAQN